MRKLADFRSYSQASCFYWYLQSLEIEAWFDEEDESNMSVWLIDESQREAALSLVKEFEQSPNKEHYEAQAKKAKNAFLVKSHRERLAHRRAKALAHSSFVTSFPVTITLMTSCILIFLNHYFLDKQRLLFHYLSFSADPLARLGMKNFTEIANGEIWRLVTPALMHSDWFHIIFNLLWFYQFSRQVEAQFSSKRVLSLFLSITICSHLVFYLVSGPLFLGMSGVNYGLLAYIWSMERYSSQRMNLDSQSVVFFVFWYVLCLLLTVLGMPVANSIHGVGAAIGAISGIVHSGRAKNFILYLKHDPKAVQLYLWFLALVIAGMIVDHFTY